MNYPKQVSVLTPKNLCRFGSEGEICKCMCILQWVNAEFFKSGEIYRFGKDAEIDKNLIKAMNASPKFKNKYKSGLRGPWTYVQSLNTKRTRAFYWANDSAKIPLSESAKVFNRFTALMGYVVGNPEGKKV